MPKQRMTVLDIRASLAHIQSSIVGCRVNNVYDINSKTYLLKLQKSGTKERLILESGVRFHTTKFTCDKGLVPSGFAMKLRKHLRHRRLESVRQLGIDRLVDFTFVGGEESFHLILELYAAGNVILTDGNYSILTLLRVHEDASAGGGAGQVYAVRSIFDVSFARPFVRCTMEQVQEILASAPAENCMKIVTRRTDFGPALIEHFFMDVGCDRAVACSGADAKLILEVLNRCYDILDNAPVLAASRGFITMKNAGDDSSFEEFWPLPLLQHAGKHVKAFDKFDTACDEFFSLVESQRRVAAHDAQVKAVMSKVDKVKRDNERRLEELQNVEQLNLTKAQLIQDNLADVDAVIAVINSMLAQGMDWAQLRALVKSEQRTGNPVANLIRHLRMEQNCVTVLLSSRDEEDISKPMVEIEIDLALNARKNAQDYFDQRRKAVQKHEKTGAAAIKAIKGAERKAAAEIVKVKEVSAVKVERQPLWFEKFCWFITSENFLVLSGHDAQQNEILVKRYLRKGDLYVHADAHGAASTIVKANDPSSPIPPLSIAEAGAMTVFRSSAWSSKMVTSAYWVNPDQVSKSAPSGEYLSKGGFMIRGRKNFLPANQLIAGFGIMFKVHSSCMARHAGERRIRGFGEDSSQFEGAEGIDEFSEQSSENGSSDDDANDEQSGAATVPLTMDAVATLQHGSSTIRISDAVSANGGACAASVVSESQRSRLSKVSRLSTSDDVDRVSSSFKVFAVGKDFFEEEPEPEEDPAAAAAAAAAQAAQAEKRRLRKEASAAASLAAADPIVATTTSETRADIVVEPVSSSQSQDKPQAKQQSQDKPQPKQAHVRGKSGQRQKIKDKYRDQDDEERELALEVLGSRGEAQKARELEAAAEKERLKAAAVAKAGSSKRPPQGPRKEPREAVGGKITNEGADAEDDIDSDEEKRLGATDLDSITARPFADDVILCALPVCAPYASMQSFKFRAKVVPGTNKRGKGAKAALEAFLRHPELTAQERDAIKALKIEELASQMLPEVRVTTSIAKK